MAATTPLHTYASFVPRLIVERYQLDPAPPNKTYVRRFPAAVLFADVAGFTRLTEDLAKSGPAGAENLAHRLNTYFGTLIDVVVEHGGDVIKFAGDALIAVWPATDYEHCLTDAVLAAVRAGFQAQSELLETTPRSSGLSLKINVSCGELLWIELGGVFGRWEWFVAGEPLTEVGLPGQQAEPDQVVVSKAAWIRVQSQCSGTMLDDGRVRADDVGPSASPLAGPPTVVATPAMSRALHSYLPGTVLSRMAAGQSSWLAELRTVTTIFVNLPSMNLSADPDDAQDVMCALQTTIYRYEGSVNKLSVDDKGTTLVAVFGLPPLTHEDDPVRAVATAMEVQSALSQRRLGTSIGIGTGRVFCGTIGNDTRREYTVMGDVVNLTARLMQAANGGILCDQRTFERSASRIQMTRLPPIAVKGKQDAVELFRPLGLIHGVDDHRMEMVGRGQETNLILDTIRSISSDLPTRVVAISGEPGAGKSCLVDRINELAKKEGLLVLRGASDAGQQAAPWHVWKSVFENLFELQPSTADVREVQEAVAAALATIQESDELAPLLNAVLPVGLPETETTREMDGNTRSDNTQRLLARLLQNTAKENRVCVILEDLHWFDSASLALAEFLSRNATGISIVLTMRSNSEQVFLDSTLPASSELVRIQLTGLNRSEMHDQVCRCLDVGSVPDEVIDWLYSRSNGHPFFTHELVLALRDSEFFTVVDRTLKVRADQPMDQLDCPDSVEAVVVSRLDSLSPQEQMVAKTASVIGRQFASRLLADVYPIEGDRARLPEHLKALIERDLTLTHSQIPDLVYRFSHGIIQEVSYNLMLYSQRRQLHRAVAEWIEINRAGELPSLYPLLARHWAEADDERAITYHEKAGTAALRDGVFSEATSYLSDALLGIEQHELADSCPLRVAGLHRQLADAHLGLGDLTSCRRHCIDALAHLGYRSRSGTWPRLPALAIEFVRQAAHRAGLRRRALADAGEALEAARVYGTLSEIDYLANDTLGLLTDCFRMLNLAETAEPGPELSRACANMSLMSSTIPLHSVARSFMRRAASTAARINHRPSQAWAAVTAGIYQVGTGDWTSARTSLEKAISIYRDLEDRRQLGLAGTILGASWYFTGAFRKGARVWEDILESAVERGDVLQQAWSFGGQALNLHRLGAIEAAAELAEQALDIFGTNADRISEIATLGVLTMVRLRQSDHDGAKQAADRCHTLLKQLGYPTSYYLLEGYAAVAEFEVSRLERPVSSQLDKQGQAQSAARAVAELKSFARVFRIGQPRRFQLEGRLAVLRGKPAQAITAWRRGWKVAVQLGMEYEAAVLSMRLGRGGALRC